MIHQTKVLKTLLKKHNITNKYGKLSVSIERYSSCEWGIAVAHVVYLTDEQVSALKKDNEYLIITGNKESNFSIVKY